MASPLIRDATDPNYIISPTGRPLKRNGKAHKKLLAQQMERNQSMSQVSLPSLATVPLRRGTHKKRKYDPVEMDVMDDGVHMEDEDDDDDNEAEDSESGSIDYEDEPVDTKEEEVDSALPWGADLKSEEIKTLGNRLWQERANELTRAWESMADKKQFNTYLDKLIQQEYVYK